MAADATTFFDAQKAPPGPPTQPVIAAFPTLERDVVAYDADNPAALPKPILPVTATINGVPATVTYYGAAPGLIAGLLQVNIMVPPGATSGNVVLTIGGNRSQTGVTVAIR